MKTTRCSMMAVFAAAAVFALPMTGMAADHSKMDHSTMDHSKMGHDMTKMAGNSAAAAPKGAMIKHSMVDGYMVMYHLLSWKERNEVMKDMLGMEMAGMDNSGKATNHLMAYLTGPDGKEVAGAKVGFQLLGPGGTDQKTLTMAMEGGYGADVILKAKGVYTIKGKFVVGAKTIVDEFKYEVK